MPSVVELPDAREDGLCADCERRQAVTRDGRFCKVCLRKRINSENFIEDSRKAMGREQLGRRQRATQGGRGEDVLRDDV